MDRGLLGTLLVCLVASSVLVMLLLGERARSSLTILKVEYPDRFSTGVLSRFALNLLARKDIEDLVVRYSYLYRVSGPAIDELLKTDGFNQSVLSDQDPYKFLRLPKGMVPLMQELPEDVWFETQRATVPYTYRDQFQTREVGLSIRFYDFSRMVQWSPASASPGIYAASTAFALLSIETGNISYFQGTSDFYLNRDDSTSDIEMGKDGEASLYLNPKMREISGEFAHVNNGPPFGTARFGGLRKGQRAYLSFTTRDIVVPAIQVIRFWINGELSEGDTQFVFLGSPF